MSDAQSLRLLWPGARAYGIRLFYCVVWRWSMSDSRSLRPLSPDARAYGIRLFYCVVWQMRFAHLPHNTIKFLRGEAARVPANILRIRQTLGKELEGKR